MMECTPDELPSVLADLGVACRLFIIAVPHDQTPAQLMGQRGAKARTDKLSPTMRSKIAKKAAQARWKKPSYKT